MNKSLTLKKKIKAYLSGKSAEKQALDYLICKKWTIIATNYKTIYGEIDIIATLDNTLVAFEIKTRKDIEILKYTITTKQQMRIINAFNYYISENEAFSSYNLRLDAIFIYPNKTIHHIENAWDDVF